VKALKTKASSFEKALNQISKRLLELPASAVESLPAARKVTRDIVALCDTALRNISAKGGRTKIPGRVTCALIVIEAWAFAKGKTPGANNSKTQEACEDYWRACGGQPVGKGEPGNWRLTMADALAKESALGRYIRNEIQRCTK
jgi:hypothetical protein